MEKIKVLQNIEQVKVDIDNLKAQGDKANIIVTDNPNIQREPNTFYFIVTDSQNNSGGAIPGDEIKISPTMGIKII